MSGKIMAMQICFSIDTVFSWPIRKKVIKKDETEGEKCRKRRKCQRDFFKMPHSDKQRVKYIYFVILEKRKNRRGQ